MTTTTKIFIVERDEPSLLLLNLWLDNIEDIEIVGSSLADPDILDRVKKAKPDVVIYKSGMRNTCEIMRRFKKDPNRPGLIMIRDGNFLALEGMLDGIPEILIPSTYTCEQLLDSIKRAARKRTAKAKTAKMPLTKAG